MTMFSKHFGGLGPFGPPLVAPMHVRRDERFLSLAKIDYKPYHKLK